MVLIGEMLIILLALWFPVMVKVKRNRGKNEDAQARETGSKTGNLNSEESIVAGLNSQGRVRREDPGGPGSEKENEGYHAGKIEKGMGSGINASIYINASSLVLPRERLGENVGCVVRGPHANDLVNTANLQVPLEDLINFCNFSLRESFRLLLADELISRIEYIRERLRLDLHVGGKCVLVTGGAGYIGSHIVHALQETRQYKVVSTDNFHNSYPRAFSRLEELARSALPPDASETEKESTVVDANRRIVHTGRVKQRATQCESIILDLTQAEPRWHAISLRYFNPAGAHPSSLIGEDPRGRLGNLLRSHGHRACK
ncbi:hypothetical protein BGY98DRAFT_1179725 [Russula aff. rugulosa BPL654]|nr:hypothetical protein BGY98DRAFT_1181557 [Russula aff. rugulosa BPL654]KAI0270823.1 hypothetical protein BGY98DRAFT_1179725 [Russula aff. rugulosa BPL654]